MNLVKNLRKYFRGRFRIILKEREGSDNDVDSNACYPKLQGSHP